MIRNEITKWGHIRCVLCSDIGPIANNSPRSTGSTSRLFRCLSISKISRLNLSSFLFLHNLYWVHPQQYIGVTIMSTMRTTMRKISIINTIMKNDDPASKSNFIRFFESSTFASLISLPWMEGASGAMAACIPRTVPVPIAELEELIKSFLTNCRIVISKAKELVSY